MSTIDAEQVEQLMALLCDDKGYLNEKGVKLSVGMKFENLGEILAKDFDKVLKAAS